MPPKRRIEIMISIASIRKVWNWVFNRKGGEDMAMHGNKKKGGKTGSTKKGGK